MILYRIIRKQDGKAFVSQSDHPHGSIWGSSGVFFKKPSTIKGHLHNLCFDWKWQYINGRFQFWAPAIPIFPDPDIGRLDNYIVEKLRIHARSTDRHDAADFIEMMKEAA